MPKERDNKTGIVVGAVVGALAAVVGFGTAVVLHLRRRQSEATADDGDLFDKKEALVVYEGED